MFVARTQPQGDFRSAVRSHTAGPGWWGGLEAAQPRSTGMRAEMTGSDSRARQAELWLRRRAPRLRPFGERSNPSRRSTLGPESESETRSTSPSMARRSNPHHPRRGCRRALQAALTARCPGPARLCPGRCSRLTHMTRLELRAPCAVTTQGITHTGQTHRILCQIPWCGSSRR